MIAWTVSAQAEDFSRPLPGSQGIWSDCLQLIVISDCTANESYGFQNEFTENTSLTARSFYPANSLNVLKKALYAFDARPSDLSKNSVAG